MLGRHRYRAVPSHQQRGSGGPLRHAFALGVLQAGLPRFSAPATVNGPRYQAIQWSVSSP